jgi:hypothetical protein
LLGSDHTTLHVIENLALYLLIIPATAYVRNQLSNHNFYMSLLKKLLEYQDNEICSETEFYDPSQSHALIASFALIALAIMIPGL